MMTVDGELASPWSVILAGGDGERTRPFIERWLGYHKPKQFCTFAGRRSLLQQTVDRADALSVPDKRISVVAREYGGETRKQLAGRGEGIVIAQPANRGTAPGLLVALARIHAVDPGGLAVVYPSDHFIRPEEPFVTTVADGVVASATRPERLVLIGVTPQGPELDYGWIQPGARLDGDGAPLYQVAAFVEKPSPETGDAILSRGGLWNSMVLVGKVATFWNLGWKLVPEIMPLLTRYREAVGTPREEVVLSAIYEAMPPRDFSKHVLQKAPEKLAVLPLENVLWSDWGRPERIAETLRAIGAEPAFSEEHLVAS